MIRWLAVAWLACSTAPPPAAIPAPPKASTSRDASWQLEEGPELVGLCDASAGVWVGGSLYVADDERNVLHRFDGQGRPLGTVELAAAFPALAGDKEADLEGATLASGTSWWIGSHDRGKGTEPRPSRQRLFAVDLDEGQAGSHRELHTTLLDALAAQAELGPILATTAGNTSKAVDGFSIEGLATADDGLWLGLRAPVVDGRALMVPLATAGDGLVAGSPVRLELGGRGIRALENLEDSLIIVAGPPADAGTFAVYRWDATGTTPIEVSLRTLRPEGLVATPDGLWLLSDDGGLERGGTPCKKLPAAQQRARTAWLRPPASAVATPGERGGPATP